MPTRLKHISPLRLASALVVAGAAPLAIGAGGSAAAADPTAAVGAPRALLPSIDPANFVKRIDNRYFPLRPGTRFHYEGLARWNHSWRRMTTRPD